MASCGSGCLANAPRALQLCGTGVLAVVVLVLWWPRVLRTLLLPGRPRALAKDSRVGMVVGPTALTVLASGGNARAASVLSTRSIGGESPPSQPRAPLAVANVTCRGKTVHLLGGPLLEPFASNFVGAPLAFPLWRVPWPARLI